MEGRRPHRLGHRLGLDDIRLDFTGERVGLCVVIKKLSLALVSLIKNVDNHHIGSVLFMNAKIQALLA